MARTDEDWAEEIGYLRSVVRRRGDENMGARQVPSYFAVQAAAAAQSNRPDLAQRFVEAGAAIEEDSRPGAPGWERAAALLAFLCPCGGSVAHTACTSCGVVRGEGRSYTLPPKWRYPLDEQPIQDLVEILDRREFEADES